MRTDTAGMYEGRYSACILLESSLAMPDERFRPPRKVPRFSGFACAAVSFATVEAVGPFHLDVGPFQHVVPFQLVCNFLLFPTDFKSLDLLEGRRVERERPAAHVRVGATICIWCISGGHIEN